MAADLYQQLRLWCGIVSITLNLAFVWGATFLAPGINRIFLDAPLFLLLPAVVIGGQLWLLPFDFLTGHLLERAAGRTELTAQVWLRDWLGGVGRFVVAMSAAGLIFAMEPLRTLPVQAILLVLLGTIMVATALCLLGILPAGQLLARSPDSRFSTGLQSELQRLKLGQLMVVWVRDGETTGVNGAALDFFKPHTVLLAESVARQLTPREAALLVAREVDYVRRGRRWQSLAICVSWLLGGVALGWMLPAEEGLQSALLPMAVVSTWCLLGLFIWPNLSRAWVLKADRWLATQVGAEEVTALLQKVQSLNATDTALPPWKRRIFHPIPPLQDRVSSIR